MKTDKTHRNHPHLSLRRTAAALLFAAVALLTAAPSSPLLLLFPSAFGIEDNDNNNNNIPITAVSLTESNNDGSSTTSAAANGSTGPADFNIAAAGDWGCTSNTEATVDNIVDKDPELVIGLGDYSYDDSADCWFEIVDPIIDKMIIAIGNHELEPPGILDDYMNRFGLEEQYYTHRIGNAFVLVMSQEVPFDEDSDQYDFVVSSLSDASSDPDVDWIIVATPETMYSSPSSASDTDALRNTYHELFEENDVDLVLQANVHNYERSYPLEYSEEYSDKNPDVPIETSLDEDTYVDPEGQIFVTVGTGGHSIHGFEEKRAYIVTQYEGYGFLDITITTADDGDGGEKRLVGTFYENDDGSIVDQFTVIKEEVEEDEEEDLVVEDEEEEDDIV
jgi:hypothetical protein